MAAAALATPVAARRSGRGFRRPITRAGRGGLTRRRRPSNRAKGNATSTRLVSFSISAHRHGRGGNIRPLFFRAEEIRAEMAKGGGGMLLPVSAEAGKGNGGGGGGGGAGDDAALFKGSAMTRRGAVAALSYMACSVLLVMFNKAALSSYNFPCANVITLLQMVCSTALLYVLRRLKIISFINSEPSVPSGALFFVPFRILLRTTPLSLAYLLYMLASMESVRGVNVPMYTTLRRTTVVFTMIMEYFLAKQKHTPPIIGSVALIVFGAFVAGARDLSFDARGYAIVFVANITTAVYLATINRIGKSSGLNSFGLMWCNGLVCGPSVLFLTYIQGDLKRTVEFPYLYSPGFQVVLLFSCMLAFLLNYTIFWNTILNSALTQSMCGNLKDFFTVGIGWVLFGGLPFDLLNVIGQGLGFLGSGLYAYCKIKGK